MAAKVTPSIFAVALCATLALLASSPGADAHTIVERAFNYDVRQFVVPLDHFSFLDNATFSIRYLINDSYAEKANPQSPIFFYTGNEGDIEWFAQNSGFVWQLAAKFRAVVVFAEHRYYGKSLPFGSATFNTSHPEHLAYFTVEQTLEDFALLITYLRQGRYLPVVAFGGSYGGMLAAWFRIKYPHMVIGSLAASAPIWQFQDLVPCDIFNIITTKVFENAYNANCSANIAKSWKLFESLAATDAGKKQLNDAFHLCEPLKSAEDYTMLKDYLTDVYGNLAMANYPYPTSFLAPLPANPVRQMCFYLKELHSDNGTDLLHAMTSALGVYTNFTGTVKCLDLSPNANSNADSAGWDIQTCNQMVMPFCANSSNTMFTNSEWNIKTFSDECYKKYKLIPKPYDIIQRYGGKHLEAASNIIFSNGLLDPWSGGGVLQAPNDQLTVIILPEGAHHLDLRNSDPADPSSVIAAREKEAEIIGQWIVQFNAAH